jgi:hypothetical protein
MADWTKFKDLYQETSTRLDALTADQTPPTFAQVFDQMVAVCALAGPEQTINSRNGDFTDKGSVILYESNGPIRSECDLWIVSILQNDGGYSANKVGTNTWLNFSHEEPEWGETVMEWLSKTYWRKLNPPRT